MILAILVGRPGKDNRHAPYGLQEICTPRG